MKATGLNSINVPVNKEYKITARELGHCIDERRAANLPPLKGLILSSPSNPTGAMLSADELRDLCKLCDENGIVFLSDEIYHGITYAGKTASTALEFSNSPLVINSFSKYFSMTGWRLGACVFECTQAIPRVFC
jgi:aspartate/methionine/tyrosine aminotransferase